MDIFLNPLNGIEHPVFVLKKIEGKREDFFLRPKPFKKRGKIEYSWSELVSLTEDPVKISKYLLISVIRSAQILNFSSRGFLILQFITHFQFNITLIGTKYLPKPNIICFRCVVVEFPILPHIFLDLRKSSPSIKVRRYWIFVPAEILPDALSVI